MKRTLGTLFVLLGRVAVALWPEGVLFLAATVFFANASTFVSPAGPWVVAGVACLALGVVASLPKRAA